MALLAMIRKPRSHGWIFDFVTLSFLFLLGIRVAVLHSASGHGCANSKSTFRILRPCRPLPRRSVPVPLQLTPGCAPMPLLTASNAPNETVHVGGLPVVAETFLYLSMGADLHRRTTRQRGCIPNSALIYLTWNVSINLKNERGCNRSTTHFPGSTWTTGRNELLRQAFLLEAQLAWRYEFFIFTDDDAVLTSYIGGDAEQLFRSLLLSYRPLRASVRFGQLPIKPVDQKIYTCANVCFTDSCVDAYHRTGVSVLLLYLPDVDNISWSMSGYISSLAAAALGPRHCHVYRQVGVNLSTALHANYPRGHGWLGGGPGWVASQRVVLEHLVKNRVPGFKRNQDLRAMLKSALYGVGVNGSREACQLQSKGVDYAKLLKYSLY